jgi:hypothetical protein
MLSAAIAHLGQCECAKSKSNDTFTPAFGARLTKKSGMTI